MDKDISKRCESFESLTMSCFFLNCVQGVSTCIMHAWHQCGLISNMSMLKRSGVVSFIPSMKFLVLWKCIVSRNSILLNKWVYVKMHEISFFFFTLVLLFVSYNNIWKSCLCRREYTWHYHKWRDQGAGSYLTRILKGRHSHPCKEGLEFKSSISQRNSINYFCLFLCKGMCM